MAILVSVNAATATLKCKHIERHDGIVATLPTSRRHDVHGVFSPIGLHFGMYGLVRSSGVYFLCLARCYRFQPERRCNH